LLVTVGCIVAIDIAKTKLVAAIATATGDVLKLVKFEHPRQTGAFLRLLEALQSAKREPVVVMEPTGTYGDASRAECAGGHDAAQVQARLRGGARRGAQHA
jgi:hypothetical protein